MSQAHSAATIEIEIQNLLIHHQISDLVADHLIKKYENRKLLLAEFEALATFLMHGGFHATLVDMITRKLEDGSEIPWGHYAEAMVLSTTKEVDFKIKSAIFQGAEENFALNSLARTYVLDDFRPELEIQRNMRRRELAEKAVKRKKELREQLAICRSQNLYQEEERIIQTLMRIHPGDMELFHLRADLRDRMAQDYIAKRSERPRKEIFFPAFEPIDPESRKMLAAIEASMIEALASAQFLANDFAIAHMIWENHEAALRLVELAPESALTDWTRAEILLRSRRFIELLDELLVLEKKYDHDPETIFAVHYLRAQALWGLEQKKFAIEILEGMVEARPHYRAAHSLLSEWKEDFL
ncbi:MAG: hypothetical protein ACXWC9_04730 [Pseudobdellovibrionaceae bacterium]